MGSKWYKDFFRFYNMYKRFFCLVSKVVSTILHLTVLHMRHVINGQIFGTSIQCRARIKRVCGGL